jgi:hypothetical protein
MSADFTKILVKDDRLEVVDNIKYAVMKGGQNVTMSQFKAISDSDSQIVFNIQVPSEQTIIDRRVLLQTDLTLTVVSQCNTWAISAAPAVTPIAAAAPAGGCGYGQYASLAPYPLHQLMTVASATINNNTVSINIRDVLPFIVRALDKGYLNSFNGMSATATDSLLKYSSGVSLASNPLGGGVPTLDTDMVGRGSIYLKGYSCTVGTPTNQTTEVFTFHISEPLMISPFIYCDPKSNAQGFYGIQNMNIVLNIGDTSRCFRGFDGVDGITSSGTYSATQRYASPAGDAIAALAAVPAAGSTFRSLPVIKSVTKGSTITPVFQNTFLLFTFLTPHPSDLMPARNIVPYYELPRYITSLSTPTVITPTVAAPNTFLPVDTNGGTQLISQTLQLNQIPDRLVLMVRKPLGQQSFGDSDSFLPIRKVSINFNNNSGILSAARCEDLYRMSKDNGSNQSWNEWVGCVATPVVSLTAVDEALPYLQVPVVSQITQALPSATSFNVIPTCGSCLMLEFGKDIQLIEDFFSSGSLGNFNVQVQLAVDNYNQSIGSTVEMVMITMNSGVFVCERGTSSTYTGILTRADVLEASEQDAYSHADVRRMVGGGFLDRLKSGVSKLAPLLKTVASAAAPHVKEYLGKQGSMGKLAAQGIGALGYGSSGAGRSGAGISGGALHGRYM